MTWLRAGGQQSPAAIINVSSMLGRVPMAPIRSAYSASKHALNALSASLRMELHTSDPGIRVSVVHPGIVATDVIDDPRADVYTFPGAKQMVTGYFSADDMAAAEEQFLMPRRS